MKKGVYLKAAKLIANGREEFSCCAVSKASGIPPRIQPSPRTVYCELFEPEPNGGVYVFFGIVSVQNQLARTLALLLMHEMEKDGSL